MASLTAKLKARTLELPQELLEQIGLSEGGEVELSVEGDAITLRPREDDLSPEAAAALRETLAESLKEYRAGHVTPAFDSMDEFEAYRKTDAYRKLIESE